MQLQLQIAAQEQRPEIGLEVCEVSRNTNPAILSRARTISLQLHKALGARRDSALVTKPLGWVMLLNSWPD